MSAPDFGISQLSGDEYHAAWDAWAEAARTSESPERVKELWREVNAALDRHKAALDRLLRAVMANEDPRSLADPEDVA